MLRLYPAGFRERFGNGMEYAFIEELGAARRRGAAATLWRFVRSAVFVLAHALAERVADRSQPGRGRGPARIGNLILGLRRTLRRLAARPGFSLAAVVTFGLGIGATAAIYGVVRGVLLEPLPYEDPDGLVVVRHRYPGGMLGVPDAGYLHYGEHARTLAGLAVYVESSSPVSGTGEPLEVGLIQATPSFFSVLRVTPVLGRGIGPADTASGAPPVAVITHRFWVDRFGGDSGVLGRPVLPSERAVVVGVLPQGFTFVRPPSSIVFGNPFGTPDVFVPLRVNRARARFGNFIYQGIARLAPGATPEAAAEELRLLMPRAAEAYPGGHTVASLVEGGHQPEVLRVKDAIVGDVAQVLWILLGAVALVLAIATANVANLFLVRAEGLRRDVAVRRALGASRADVTRSFVAEGIVLALAGAVVGLVLAAVATGPLLRIAPSDVPRLDLAGLDRSAVGLALAIALAAGLGLGLLAAAPHAGHATAAVLTAEGSRSTSAGRRQLRARHILVVAQVSLALVLLAASGLLVRTFANLRAVDSGFDASGVLTMRLSLSSAMLRVREQALRPGGSFRGDLARTRFMLDLTERVRDLPGVRVAAFSGDLPLDGAEWHDDVAVEGALPASPDLGERALRVFVGPEYLTAIGARFVQGRDLERRDFGDFVRAAVVNRSFAEERWPGRDAVGQRLLQWPNAPEKDVWYTVVGVVDDVREASLLEAPEPTVYLPTVFVPDDDFSMFVSNLVLVVRTSVPPLSLLGRVEAEVRALNPEVPINEVSTLAAVVAASTRQLSFAMVLLLIAAAVALILSVVGVYGVVAYVVSLRTREFGVRVALGARPADIRGVVLRAAVGVGLVGVGFGAAGALGLTRILRSLLYGVSASDPVVFGGVAVLLLLVVVSAALRPASRAAAVDPVEAMRSE